MPSAASRLAARAPASWAASPSMAGPRHASVSPRASCTRQAALALVVAGAAAPACASPAPRTISADNKGNQRWQAGGGDHTLPRGPDKKAAGGPIIALRRAGMPYTWALVRDPGLIGVCASHALVRVQGQACTALPVQAVLSQAGRRCIGCRHAQSAHAGGKQAWRTQAQGVGAEVGQQVLR